MKVQLNTADGKPVTSGRLEEKKLEDRVILKYLGRHFMYAGLKKGVAQFREIKEPWDITISLK